VTGLPIPRYSEFVVEGEIPPVSAQAIKEGPFGEFGGYYSSEDLPKPIINAKSIYFREDPIIIGCPPFRGVKHDGALPFDEAVLFYWIHKIGFSDVKKIGKMGPFLIVSMIPRYPGHVRRIADFVMSGVGMRPPKFVLIVDEDIDPKNQKDVLWALSSRVDTEESIYLTKNRLGGLTDPRIPPNKKASGDITSSSMIIDATRPWAWRKQFPKPSDFSDELIEEYRHKWEFLDHRER
jgi:4-hydroxy-3-polyprenylbenzoate decarboxylase